MRFATAIGLALCSSGCGFECGEYYSQWRETFEAGSTMEDAGPDAADAESDAEPVEAGIDSAAPEDASAAPSSCLSGFGALHRSPLGVRALAPQWVVNAGDAGVWFSSTGTAAQKLGRVLPTLTADPEFVSTDPGGSPSGLAVARDGAIWVGYFQDPLALRTLRDPRDAIDLRGFDPAGAMRVGLAIDALERVWWIEASTSAAPDGGAPLTSTQLAFIHMPPPGGNDSTQHVGPFAGLELRLLQASARAIWFAAVRASRVVLGRVDLDGGVQMTSVPTADAGPLQGEPLDLVIGADQEAWLLADDQSTQTEGFVLLKARDDDGRISVSPPSVLPIGRARGLAVYERCGVLVSHDNPNGIGLAEPDGGVRELALPPAFDAPDAGARLLGRLVAVPDGVALLELAPPAIVILRAADP